MVFSHALWLHDVGKRSSRFPHFFFQDKLTQRETDRQEVCYSRAQQSADHLRLIKGFNIYYVNIPSGLSCEALSSRWSFEYYFNPLESAAQEVSLTEPHEHSSPCWRPGFRAAVIHWSLINKSIKVIVPTVMIIGSSVLCFCEETKPNLGDYSYIIVIISWLIYSYMTVNSVVYR